MRMDAVKRWTRAGMSEALYARLSRLKFADMGHGYDAFGAQRDWVSAAVLAARPFYDAYFRVRSTGVEHIPAGGPAILASNHSGTLPFDGAMLFCDVVRQMETPRLPRPVADLFVPMLPVVGTAFSRLGVVPGSRGNFRHLLEQGELLMVFPEGTPGIGKLFRDRYKLQTWREGHAELAIRHRAPVVPVAIIGAEEQMPQIARFDGLHPFGAPYLPVPLVLFPLPVRYHIHYGAPIHLHERYDPSDSDNPRAIKEAALEIKGVVQALIDEGLRLRKGVFA